MGARGKKLARSAAWIVRRCGVGGSGLTRRGRTVSLTSHRRVRPANSPRSTRRFLFVSWRKGRSRRSMASCAGGACDLIMRLYEEFGISVSDDTVYRALKDLGFSHVSARPKAYKQNADAMEAFKKTFPPAWRKSGRSLRPAHR